MQNPFSPHPVLSADIDKDFDDQSKLDLYLLRTPWDARAFGIDTFEIQDPSEETLKAIVPLLKPGHYMVKVDPRSPKKVLHECGFYYCDTLIEPYCTAQSLIKLQNDQLNLSKQVSLENLLAICDGAFTHGRFHRDFNIDRKLADERYNLWLIDIYHSGNFFGLMYADELAGFMGFSGSKLILHALHKKYRGMGLSKYFWILCCEQLFSVGHDEISSSISASNLPALNLYVSLGFRFRNSLDYYHRLIE